MPSNHSFSYANPLDKGLYGYTTVAGSDRRIRKWIAPGTIECISFDVTGDGDKLAEDFPQGGYVQIDFVSGKSGMFFIDNLDEFRMRVGWHLDFWDDDLDDDEDDRLHRWRDNKEA